LAAIPQSLFFLECADPESRGILQTLVHNSVWL